MAEKNTKKTEKFDILDIALSQITFLSCKEKIILRKNIDNLNELAILSLKDFEKFLHRDIKAKFFDGKLLAERTRKSAAVMEKLSIGALCFTSDDFPAMLREWFDPPYLLFYRGNPRCLEKPCVSVVGTRRILNQTAQNTLDFSKTAAREKMCVVSGLAYGVDAFAHKGALDSEEESCTCAVLPCGIDTVTPSAHKSLALRIIRSGGCLISEYAPFSPVENWRFVQRNRIIAGLSPSTVVMQAPPGSGALITAQFAVDNNRELMLHECCFLEDAKKINGKKNAFNSVEKYRMEGAPVIGNFEDFVKVMNDDRINIKKNIQLELFTDQ